MSLYDRQFSGLTERVACPHAGLHEGMPAQLSCGSLGVLGENVSLARYVEINYVCGSVR